MPTYYNLFATWIIITMIWHDSINDVKLQNSYNQIDRYDGYDDVFCKGFPYYNQTRYESYK